jgi:choline monooxygenase
MSIFNINPDIRKARTLASDFYTDERYFEQSKEKIFARTWQIVGLSDEVRLSGQLKPHTILENFLDEPVLLTRDERDKLHCLSNVCTHRGNILIENPCVENSLRCRYHGRRFKLNGEFVSMPEFEETTDFPDEKDHLPKIPFDNWEQFLFASISPSAPLDEFIGVLKQRLNWLPLHEFRFAPQFSRDYLVKAHWALYCENYLEGFHIPFVHDSLNKVIDYGTYTTELFRYANLQLGLSKNDLTFDLPKTAPDFGKPVAAYYFWIFPNLMFNFYPWGLSLNIVKPIQCELTRVSFLTYLRDETKFLNGAEMMLDKVEREDEAIVENVQRGIKSRFYTHGRYSPTREQGTHHFHRLISEFMN